MNFPENLKKIRKRYNLTQKRLAELLNKSDTAISNWEKGVNEPDLSSMIFLCNEYNINMHTLIFGKVDSISEKQESTSEGGCMMTGGCVLRRVAVMEAKMKDMEGK